MEVAILVISVISAAGSIIAIIFAYEAWRNPQPDLEFVLESAKITKAHSRRYFLKVEATVINSSSVDAILDDVKINNVSLKGKGKETVSLDKWDVKPIALYDFMLVRPGYILKANNSQSEGLFNVVVDAGEKKPEKVMVKIM